VTAIPTPEEWLARFNATIEDVKSKTEAFQRDLAQAGVTESAPDGSVSVTVAPNGSLTGLRIEDEAWRGSGAELSAKVMRLVRKAQRAAAVNVAEAFAPLGADSEAMHMITGYLPEPEEDDEEEPAGPAYAFEAEPEPAPPPPPPSRPYPGPPAGPPAGPYAGPPAGPPAGRVEPPRRPTRPRSGADDDEDFGNDDIFGR
jgi:DNA-binding protein YbaB